MLKSLSGIHALYLNFINLGSYLDDVDGVDFTWGTHLPRLKSNFLFYLVHQLLSK